MAVLRATGSASVSKPYIQLSRSIFQCQSSCEPNYRSNQSLKLIRFWGTRTIKCRPISVTSPTGSRMAVLRATGSASVSKPYIQLSRSIFQCQSSYEPNYRSNQSLKLIRFLGTRTIKCRPISVTSPTGSRMAVLRATGSTSVSKPYIHFSLSIFQCQSLYEPNYRSSQSLKLIRFWGTRTIKCRSISVTSPTGSRMAVLRATGSTSVSKPYIHFSLSILQC